VTGPGREDPGFAGLQFLHQVIGGPRIERGVASLGAGHPQGYQYRSQLRASTRGSELSVEAVVPHELAVPILEALRGALADLGQSGLDSTSFAAELTGRAQGLAFRYESADERMREAVALLLAGRPLAAAENPVAATRTLRRAQVVPAWQALLDPGRTAWVVLGRADELGPKLAAAGIEATRGDLFEVATGTLFAVPADTAYALPGAASTVQAEELLMSAIEAKGGLQALERIAGYTLEDSLFVKPVDQIVPGTRTLHVRFPDRYREELVIAALQGRGVIQVIDGNDVWRDQLGRVQAASQARKLDLLGRLWMDGLRVFHRYAQPGARVFMVDPTVIGSTTLDGLQLNSPDGNWVRLYFHPQSRLLVKRTSQRPGDRELFALDELFTDYRPVEGVFIPFISATYLDGEYSSESHTIAIALNPPLPDDLFKRKAF
jgi:hypothetical protein